MKDKTTHLSIQEPFVPDYKESDFRECPECGELSISGMPGGRDATCKNCGYKDPCCSD